MTNTTAMKNTYTKLNTQDFNKYQKFIQQMTSSEKQKLKDGFFPSRLVEEANKQNVVVKDIYKYARLMIV